MATSRTTTLTGNRAQDSMIYCPYLHPYPNSSISFKDPRISSRSNLYGSSSIGHVSRREAILPRPDPLESCLGVRMIPVSLLEKPRDLLYPFQQRFLTWAARVQFQRLKEAGVTAVEKVKGQPMLIWTESGKPVGEIEIYNQPGVNGPPLPDCLMKPTGPF